MQEFPEELLEKVFNEEELKEYSERSRTAERRQESEPSSPMPQFNNKDEESKQEDSAEPF